MWAGKHPDKSSDEIFLGNSTRTSVPTVAGVTTFRMGKPAYDIHGKELDDRYSALFVGKKDMHLYDAFMTRQV